MGDCLLRRKNAIIPYTTVDYIQFNGTTNSVLDTGIPYSGSPGDEIEVTFDIGGRTSAGVFQVTNSSAKLCLGYSSEKYKASSGNALVEFVGSNTGKHTFIANRNGKHYFDDVEVVSSYTPQSSTSYTYSLGRYSTTTYLNGKIYEFKIKSNTTSGYLMWLVPVQYDDNGTTKYGFYDKVSKTLKKKNAWTGGND